MQEVTAKEIIEKIRVANAEQLSVLERSLAADTRKSVLSALRSARKRLDAAQRESDRIHSMYSFDSSQRKDDANGYLIGLDEVGRGPLAGPVAVGGVILDLEDEIKGLNDSKQLSEAKRDQITAQIKQRALFWTVQYVDASEIDRNGILHSLKKAFQSAITEAGKAGFPIDVVLLDGNPLHIDKREVSIVKGDSKSASIAAASIVAKTSRDALMVKLNEEYPEYGFDMNKGYGTKYHIDAIKAHGLSPVHRASFCLDIVQPTLF